MKKSVMKYLPNRFHVKIINPGHYAAVEKRLFELGFSWLSGDTTPIKRYHQEKYIGVNDGNIIRSEGGAEITLTDLYIIPAGPQLPVTRIGEYDVTFKDGILKVGCTEIYPSTVRKLAKFLDEVGA